MASVRADAPRGVLRSGDAAAGVTHARYWPSAELAAFVEHYWCVEWHVPTPLVRETLPHPVVHIVLENDTATLAGPTTRRFTTTLAGRGRVFGVKFHPGGFRPFVQTPVHEFADRTLALHTLFGERAVDLAARALAPSDPSATIAVVEAFLLDCGAREDATSALMRQVAEFLAQRHDIVRTQQLARAFGLGTRTLQRQFRDYVGVHPKWVIQRYRLHEALARIDAADGCNWSELALELGYADQAHLIRDFRQVIGRTPAGYARKEAPAAVPTRRAARGNA